jgi:hypothetical protein
MINSIFEQLASDSGRNFKIDLLNQHRNNDLLKEVIRLALDPFTQFYIRKIPKYEQKEVRITLDAVPDLLFNLSNRHVTGNAAITFLADMLSHLSADDAKVVERIIQKDLKCGVSESTVNTVWPGLVHEYPCMLASAYDQKLIARVTYPAIVQLKLDGMRFNAVVRNGAVEFRSRSGKEIQIADPSFSLPFIALAGGEDVVFDGELLCRDADGNVMDRKTGNGIINKAVKGTQLLSEGQLVCAQLWDVIPFANFNEGKYNVGYDQRFADLTRRVTEFTNDRRVEVVETKSVDNIDQVREIFEQYLAMGLEGIIMKTNDMIWENKRSKKQIKFKGELECDLKVVGWVEGTGKHTGRLGALALESSDGLVKVSVGTGFSDVERDTITQADIGRIVAIKYNARINDKRSDVDSLFLPVFIEFRDDKLTADSSSDIK